MSPWGPDFSEKRNLKIITSDNFKQAYQNLKTTLHQYNNQDINPSAKVATINWHEFGLLNLAMFNNFSFTQISLYQINYIKKRDDFMWLVFDIVRESLSGMTFLVSGLECLMHSCLILHFPNEYTINGGPNNSMITPTDYKKLFQIKDTANRPKYKDLIDNARQNWFDELNGYRNMGCHTIIAHIINDQFLDLNQVCQNNNLRLYDRNKLESICRGSGIYGGTTIPAKYPKSMHDQLKDYLDSAYQFAAEMMTLMLPDIKDNGSLFSQ